FCCYCSSHHRDLHSFPTRRSSDLSMPIAAFVLMTLFMVIVLPIIVIMHYVTKWKEARGLSTEEQELLEELWRASQKMESRLNSLETILDDQAPDWKKKT